MTKALRFTAVILIWLIERYEGVKERVETHYDAFIEEWVLFENEDGTPKEHPILDVIMIVAIAFNILIAILFLAKL